MVVFDFVVFGCAEDRSLPKQEYFNCNNVPTVEVCGIIDKEYTRLVMSRIDHRLSCGDDNEFLL